MDPRRVALLLALSLASPAAAQFGPGSFPGRDNDGGGGSDDAFGDDDGGGFLENFQTSGTMILTAHAVLAALSFVVLFPIGSILIRLGSFRGCWIVHALFQIFTYAAFISAAGLGLYMAHSLDFMTQPHPIIGLVLLGVLFIQPFLGAIHHAQFKKYGRRTIWSHAHIWLGRLAITLGMINGGLGLMLASTKSPVGIPPHHDIIAYGVVAGVMWVIYVASAVWGESRRGKVRGVDPSAKEAGRHEHLSNWNNGNNF